MEKRSLKKEVAWKECKNKLKDFFSKNRKIIIILSIALLLFFSYALYRAWINFHFLTTDDILLDLKPQDSSFSVHYGENPNITFSVDLENSLFCNAQCSYEFSDISLKYVVENGSFTRRGIGKKFEKEFQLSADRSGTGQKIYTFSVQCNNIRTYFCPTDENKRKRTSFVTLNYDLSDYELFLKDTIKDNITRLIKELEKIDVKMQELNSRFFDLGFIINLNNIENEKEILNNDYNSIVMEFENLERVWSEEDYLLLSELFNLGYGSKIEGISQRIGDINSKISNVLDRHNAIISDLNAMDYELRIDNSTVNFLGKINDSLIFRHKIFLEKIRELKSEVNANSFVSYSALEGDLDELKSSFEVFKDDKRGNFLYPYLAGNYYLNLEKEILCSIKGLCMNWRGFASIILNSLHTDYDEIYLICSSLESIKIIHAEENNKSAKFAENYDYGAIADTLEYAKNKKIEFAKKTIFDEIKNIYVDSEANSSLQLLTNISRFDFNVSGEIDYNTLSEDEALSLIHSNFSEDSEKYFDNYCKPKGEFDISGYFSGVMRTNEINDVKLGNFTSRIKIELTPNYPVCCVFNECKRCCTREECKNDPLLYPVLFLHGHSFNKDNSPDFSLDVFNKIQAQLQEDGYISAGTITPVSDYSEINQGEWGLSSKPISVKGSYYLVSYYNLGSYSIATQKSENIETYAIRLKELVELLKFRTGKDKVNIIAHSMGSLVARSYIQIFGSDSVDKLIMIAAPNNGISGKVNNYCPIFGEKKECYDMSENSIFIKKLNDPLKIPKNIDIYNIVGVGCSMDGKEGDGIILKENAELDYGQNYFINGTCGGISKLLHTQILDIEKYPEVYSLISSVLET
jgi:uncharacterized alpha/beta hydrolase family protein